MSSNQYQDKKISIFYDNYRRSKFETKLSKNLIFFIAIFLGLNGLAFITLFQYSAYYNFIHNQTQINLENTFLCSRKILTFHIDLISTSVSFLLLIFYSMGIQKLEIFLAQILFF